MLETKVVCIPLLAGIYTLFVGFQADIVILQLIVSGAGEECQTF